MIRRSRIVFDMAGRMFTPAVKITHPVHVTPNAATEAMHLYRDEHGHLHVPTDCWVDVGGCRFPLGYWLHRQRQTRRGRRLLGLIGADVSESDQFFVDGLHHLKKFLRSKHSVPPGVQKMPSTLPSADPSDGFPLAFWYRQITSGETTVTDERGDLAADILGAPVPAWVSRTFRSKGVAA